MKGMVSGSLLWDMVYKSESLGGGWSRIGYHFQETVQFVEDFNLE